MILLRKKFSNNATIPDVQKPASLMNAGLESSPEEDSRNFMAQADKAIKPN